MMNNLHAHRLLHCPGLISRIVLTKHKTVNRPEDKMDKKRQSLNFQINKGADLSPKTLRKYQEADDTQEASKD